MPRGVRKTGKNGYIHIIVRGVNHQDIFYHDSDYERFLKILGELKEKMGFEVICYCLMSNHVHLLLHDKGRQFPLIMRLLAGRYAQYFNCKYERSGHLFQNRYLSRPIDTTAYLLTCVAYIHNNPEKAHICPREKYRWSSFSDYLATDGETFCSTDFVRQLAGSREVFVAMHDHQNPSNTFDEQHFEYGTELEDSDVRSYLCDMLGKEDPTYIQTLQPKQRNIIINELKNLKIPCRQIARITGLSLYMVSHTNGRREAARSSKNK